MEKLLALVQIKATALRDGSPREIPVEEVVPGDVVLLNAGDIIPGDCLVDESKDLFVDEATLTGETYPVEKTAGVLAAETPLAQRTNASSWAPRRQRHRHGAGRRAQARRPSSARSPSGCGCGRRRPSSSAASAASATS